MILNNFRKIDLIWNNAYEKLGNVRTAQYDEKGRKLVVQVTDGGDIVDLTGAELKLVTVDGLEYENRNLLPTNPNLYTTGTYIHYKFQDKPMEYLATLEDRDTEATPWTPAPEDLQFPFDLIDAQKGIYELYFPKLFVDRYTGDTKVFLELTTKDFSITSEPFYINTFEGVR